MGSDESARIADALAQRAGIGADATRVADTVLAAWHDIDAALRPVIGAGGVAALGQRSVCLAAVQHPWLASLGQGALAAVDPVALKSALAQQRGPVAVAGGAELLQTFHDLLASLIGRPLTERLLHPVWCQWSDGAPTQAAVP